MQTLFLKAIEDYLKSMQILPFWAHSDFSGQNMSRIDVRVSPDLERAGYCPLRIDCLVRLGVN